MAERSPRVEVWAGRGAFVLMAFALIFVTMLPLSTLPRAWAAPDLLLAVTFAWAARRPDFVPVLLVAGVFLLFDLLYGRPPGLWTGLVLLATEALRVRSHDLRAVPYLLEWATVAVAVIAVFMSYRLVFSLTALPQVPLVPHMFQMIGTVLCYPVVTFLSYLLAGVRRPAPGEVDALGHRI